MPDWRDTLRQVQARAAKLPPVTWAAAGVILVSLGAALWLEMAGPPYDVLEEGLSPADGGKVIAELQKLGIPYQLQAAGNVILVPEPQLAQARLQLGDAGVPGSDVASAWDKLEDAPMTESDLAQSAMAQQALELSLEQSIAGLNGIRGAQVFLALPPDTPFLADQPKPAASVVIEADDAAAQAEGEAIADLVAGAVPGMSAAQVTVETSSGVAVYPAGGPMQTGTQFATVAQVENGAAARIAGLLIPLVGAGNFQTDVSADLDFTQVHMHQITYGPAHLVSHETSSLSDSWGSGNAAAIGIPGALSNEPPTPTTAAPSGSGSGTGTGTGTGTGSGGGTGNGAGSSAAGAAQSQPTQTSSNLDQSYVTDTSDSDITEPDWSVKSVAISVVLNKAALGAVTVAQVKAAIAGAFAYPQVSVSVLAASFQAQHNAVSAGPLLAAAAPITHALLEVMAAAALLFGLAMPAGKRLAAINIQALLPPPKRPMPTILPPRDYSDLREVAGENIPGVARLLQSWAEDNE